MKSREQRAPGGVTPGPSRPRDTFYLVITSAMTCTMLLGFSFTYFGPMLRGSYPEVSPLVHVHGWTFFTWYVLLPVQAGLIRSGHRAFHRILGLASAGLGVLMILPGLLVTVVQIELAGRADGTPFWQLMGLPIFTTWLLFTGFYVEAFRRRRRVDDHKRLILLASAVALSAATARIAFRVVGFGVGSALVGMFAVMAFPLVGIAVDRRRGLPVHRVYAWGVAMTATTIVGSFLLALEPGANAIEQGLAWVGRALMPLYLEPRG